MNRVMCLPSQVVWRKRLVRRCFSTQYPGNPQGGYSLESRAQVDVGRYHGKKPKCSRVASVTAGLLEEGGQPYLLFLKAAGSGIGYARIASKLWQTRVTLRPSLARNAHTLRRKVSRPPQRL